MHVRMYVRIYIRSIYTYMHIRNWGEPERAPHKREVRAVCLSVCLSFCPYVHDTKIYKNNSNLRVPSVVNCLRRAWCIALYTNVQQTCSDKQLERTGSYTN